MTWSKVHQYLHTYRWQMKVEKYPYQYSSMNHSISSYANDGVTFVRPSTFSITLAWFSFSCVLQLWVSCVVKCSLLKWLEPLMRLNPTLPFFLHSLNMMYDEITNLNMQLLLSILSCVLQLKSFSFWQKCKEIHGGKAQQSLVHLNTVCCRAAQYWKKNYIAVCFFPAIYIAILK